jgi:hypothetical protein
MNFRKIGRYSIQRSENKQQPILFLYYCMYDTQPKSPIRISYATINVHQRRRFV